MRAIFSTEPYQIVVSIGQRSFIHPKQESRAQIFSLSPAFINFPPEFNGSGTRARAFRELTSRHFPIELLPCCEGSAIG